MSRKLDDLAVIFQPLAFEFLARCIEAGIMVCLVSTRRTLEEQQALVTAGTSWTMNSRHLQGLAFDVCPYDQWLLHGADTLQWNEKDPIWQELGKIGMGMGLKWGIKMSGRHFDLGHFEYVGS